jgi:hypothetical protein
MLEQQRHAGSDHELAGHAEVWRIFLDIDWLCLVASWQPPAICG